MIYPKDWTYNCLSFFFFFFKSRSIPKIRRIIVFPFFNVLLQSPKIVSIKLYKYEGMVSLVWGTCFQVKYIHKMVECMLWIWWFVCPNETHLVELDFPMLAILINAYYFILFFSINNASKF